MEKNDDWDWDSEYLDPKKFPYIKCIDASLVQDINLSPPDKNAYYKYWRDFPNITSPACSSSFPACPSRST
jgi:hypothetical protein